MKVLIAPWGNPFEWKETTYVFEGKTVKNLCTLPVLIEAVNPDYIIVIVLDTLANIVNREGNPKIKQRDFLNYDEVRTDVEDRVRYFVEEMLRLNFDDLKLIIAPGVGVFENIAVEGDILDYYHYLIYELVRTLPVDDATIYLDMTHGINFMPVLTYRALNHLLGLLAYLKDVKLKVLNSEPYPRGLPRDSIRNAKLNVRVVEDREIRPKPIMSLLEGDEYSKLNAFISSIANAFPLVFTTFYPNINEIGRRINNILDDFYESIEVKGKYIKRRKSLDPNIKTLSKLYYFLRVLSTHAKFKELPKNEPTLKELNEISKILFSKLPRIGIVVEEQIKHLEEMLTTNGKPKSYLWKEKGWKSLRGLFSKSQLSISCSDDESRALRNFIAHSGFEYNVTMVKADGSDIRFKYKSRKVIHYSIKALKFRLEDET